MTVDLLVILSNFTWSCFHGIPVFSSLSNFFYIQTMHLQNICHLVTALLQLQIFSFQTNNLISQLLVLFSTNFYVNVKIRIILSYFNFLRFHQCFKTYLSFTLVPCEYFRYLLLHTSYLYVFWYGLRSNWFRIRYIFFEISWRTRSFVYWLLDLISALSHLLIMLSKTDIFT